MKVKAVVLTFLLLAGCQAQEEDINKLIKTFPPLEKLTYDKDASEKIQNIIQERQDEFETLRKEAQDDTTGRWDRWGKKYRSIFIKFLKEHINTKSALTATLYLVDSEKDYRFIADNYEGTWQSIVATNELWRYLPEKRIKTHGGEEVLLTFIEYHSKHIEDYMKLDKETDPEYLRWFGEGFTDSVKYYYDKKSYFGAHYLYSLAFDYLSLDKIEKATKLFHILFNEYPDDSVERIDASNKLCVRREPLGEKKLKKEWLQGKGIKYEGFKKMESKEQERINAEWQSEFNKLSEDERKRKSLMAFADWVSTFNDKNSLHTAWGAVAGSWPDTPEGKEAYKKWIALVRSYNKLIEWLKQYGLVEKDLADAEIIALDHLRTNEKPANKVFGIDEKLLVEYQKESADILTKRPDWQEWLKGKGDISKAKPTDILEWRKEWAKSKASDSTPPKK